MVVGMRPSQSRRKPPPCTDFFNQLLYCYKGILPPEGKHETSEQPPQLRSAAPCQADSGGSQTGGIPSFVSRLHSNSLASHVSLLPAALVRGSSGMFDSRRDSVQSRRASVRVSALNIGTDTSQPRPQCCPCTHGRICRERPDTRPASAATVRPSALEPCV